jgi:hypothetical protein
VQWLNTEKTVLYLRFHNHWTLENYYTALERANRWIDQTNHTVQVIADLHDVTTFPPGLLTHTRSALASRPRNVRHVVVVVTSSAIVQIYQNAIRFFKHIHPDAHVPLRLVNTVSEACRLVGIRAEMLQEISF